MEKFNNTESADKKNQRIGYVAAFLAGALASAGVEQGINHSDPLGTMDYAADKFELSEGQGLSEQNKKLVKAFLENPSQGLTLVFSEGEVAQMDSAREFGVSDETEASIKSFESGERDNLTLHFTMEDVQKMNSVQDIFSHVDFNKPEERVRNDFEINHKVIINPKGTEPVRVDLKGSEPVRVDPVNPDSDRVRVDMENELDPERARAIRSALDAARS